MIPHEYVEEVVRRNDITDVVASYVQLRHRGRTHTGLAPSTAKRHPPLWSTRRPRASTASARGAGGDVITFIKKINNLDYVEAVKYLAGRAGMPMPEEDDKVGRLRSRVLSVNKETARFFYEQLNAPTEEAAAARAYWRGRGLSDSTIRRFGLGLRRPERLPGAAHAPAGQGLHRRGDAGRRGGSAAKRATCTTLSGGG